MNKREVRHPEQSVLLPAVPSKSLFFSFSLSVQEPTSPAGPQGTVSRMQLVFDEEEDDDEGQEGGGRSEGASRDTMIGSSTGPREPAGDPAPQDSGWDAGGGPAM